MRSFLRTIPSRALQTSYAQRPASRAFSCAPQLRLKEDKEQSPEQVEKAKQEQMKGNKNAREELTSSSEAAIHADKEQPAEKNSHIQEMQKQTANKSQQEKNGQ
ncbi:hypothetical protein D0869_13822 [Hortaea werneckii]|uniref:Uncharacterized protein n=1 Tax=Hortaea werneckii TaxID=91943 RepID=A0A3M6W400_HORWE|nr:hypothetical protein KC324_g12125 [Hortaea werneckii]KAI7519760.1 hypothetical protein KC316_g20042 [Hortaea werneckii]RMX73223.1 hypothetical protein D0869_13822 [Hortaea werneckii]RMY16940.1 hypothetical protein D0868_00030 [Hortaea werneckii]